MKALLVGCVCACSITATACQSAPVQGAEDDSPVVLETGGVRLFGAPAAESAACADGTLRDCYSDPVEGPTPQLWKCGHGLSACVSGVWARCAIDAEFTIPVVHALLSSTTPCSPCNPSCYTTTDTPGAADLVPTASNGVVYDTPRGGISLPASTASATPADADGDGVPDAADSFPADPARDGVRELGGFSYSLPYGGAGITGGLSISTQVRTADVYFLMDTTGSMDGEIANLKSTLTGTIIPAINLAIPDAWYGVGYFDDYPTSPSTAYSYGDATAGDVPYRNVLNSTSSAAAANAAVAALVMRDGNDTAESQIPALYAVATGSSLWGGTPAAPACAAGYRGYPCFRPGTIPIIVMFTDAPFHNDPGALLPYAALVGAPSYAATVAALRAIGARVITIYSGPATRCLNLFCTVSIPGLAHPNAIGVATGSVNALGNAVTYTIPASGAGLSTAVVTSIQTLANYSRMDITLRANDNPTTAVDERGFIASIATVATAESNTRCAARLGTWFQQCLPGTHVVFNVTFQNGLVAPTSVVQVFDFTVDTLGDGTIVLGTTPVRIVVPPIAPAYPVSGSYWRDFDSTLACTSTEVARWRELSWTATYPVGTTITWTASGATTTADLTTATGVSFSAPATASPQDVGDRLIAGGLPPTLPYLRIRATLNASADRSQAPVLSAFNLSFDCVPGT